MPLSRLEMGGWVPGLSQWYNRGARCKVLIFMLRVCLVKHKTLVCTVVWDHKTLSSVLYDQQWYTCSLYDFLRPWGL